MIKTGPKIYIHGVVIEDHMAILQSTTGFYYRVNLISLIPTIRAWKGDEPLNVILTENGYVTEISRSVMALLHSWYDRQLKTLESLWMN